MEQTKALVLHPSSMTILNVNLFSREQIVREVLTRLKAQNGFGINSATRLCAYRVDGNTDNHGCAVGVLIPNELYDAKLMEGIGIYSFIELDAIKNSGAPERLDILRALQYTHDNAAKYHHGQKCSVEAAWLEVIDGDNEDRFSDDYKLIDKLVLEVFN